MATSFQTYKEYKDNDKLPTKWIPPQKPAFRDDILVDKEFKEKLLNHQKQPYLNRNETEKIKNSYKKQLCVEMLRDGFHKSFRELDVILRLQIEERYRVGSEHPVWDRPLLDQEPRKLDYLCKKLNIAERSELKGEFTTMYTCYHDLANYFLLTDDGWLSNYFIEKSLNISLSKNSTIDARKQAEAHCNLGLANERSSLYTKALHHFQEYYNLTRGKDWRKKSEYNDFSEDEIDKINEIKSSQVDAELRRKLDDKMFTDACIHLQRLFKIMANRYSKDIDEKIEYLTKAYDVCKSSGIGSLEGQASYLLGNAYAEKNDLETALSCYKNYFDISKRENDLENLGQASEALAKCHQKLGQINKSIEYLQKYLGEVSSKSADRQYARACYCLGTIYNSMDKFEVAAEYAKKAFDISKQMNYRDLIDSARVLCGVTRAHKMLSVFNKNIEIANRKTVTNLVTWKYAASAEKGDNILRDVVPKTEQDEESLISKYKVWK